MASATSAGGAAGAGGVGLQNRVFAWAASALLAERPLHGVDLAGTVVRVGAQTGFAMDDVAVQTDSGEFALVQAKADLRLGRTVGSPLTDAFAQAVDQYLNGRLPVDDGSGRAFDSARDALMLCTDHTAPTTVRIDLRVALRRTGSQPPGTTLGYELTAGQNTALSVATDHVRRLWTAATGSGPGDEDLRTFFRTLHVITIDANDGEANHAAALSTLSVAVSAAQADDAWRVLVDQGQACATAREWRDRVSLGVALAQRGLHLTPPSAYAQDIETLKATSSRNLAVFADDVVLPVAGGLRISRAASDVLLTSSGSDNVLIVGGSSC